MISILKKKLQYLTFSFILIQFMSCEEKEQVGCITYRYDCYQYRINYDDHVLSPINSIELGNYIIFKTGEYKRYMDNNGKVPFFPKFTFPDDERVYEFKNGLPIKSYNHFSPNTYLEYIYDQVPRLIQTNSYEDGNLIYKEKYIYFLNGDTSEVITYYADHSKSRKYVYSYEDCEVKSCANPPLLYSSFTVYNREASFETDSIKYLYYNNGRIVVTRINQYLEKNFGSVYNKNMIIKETKNTYLNELIHTVQINQGNPVLVANFSYGKENLLSNIKTEGKSGLLSSKSYYRFQYDKVDSKNWEVCEIFHNDSKSYLVRRSIVSIK